MEAWCNLRSGTFILVWLFGFEGSERDFQNYKIFSAVQMQGRASERREIIRAYIDRARRSPDAADAGNGSFIRTLKTEQKRRKQEASSWKMSHVEATSESKRELRAEKLTSQRHKKCLSRAREIKLLRAYGGCLGAMSR